MLPYLSADKVLNLHLRLIFVTPKYIFSSCVLSELQESPIKVKVMLGYLGQTRSHWERMAAYN